VDRDARKLYFNRCDPGEPLDPGDARNVDLDQAFGGGARTEGVSWVERLAAPIESSSRPTCARVTAVPGSGLSTELRRLAARLADSGRANLLPVFLDGQEISDLASPVALPELVVAILHATHRALVGVAGPRDLDRFWRRRVLPHLDLDRSPGEGAFTNELSTGQRIVDELRTRTDAREHLRRGVDVELTRFLDEAREELVLLSGRASQLGRRGIVIVVDSFEKLRGLSTTWTEVLKSGRRLFDQDLLRLDLPVSLVSSIPVTLAAESPTNLAFLPAIRLHERGSRIPLTAGIGAARELIRARVPDAALRDVFQALDFESEIHRLIVWSGGSPGNIVRLLRQCVAQAPASPAGLERILETAGDTYRRMLLETDLHRVARAVRSSLPFTDAIDREPAARMLASGALLRYEDGAPWFDLHPAVRELAGWGEPASPPQTPGAGRSHA
jgi:hypothetical protein